MSEFSKAYGAYKDNKNKDDPPGKDKDWIMIIDDNPAIAEALSEFFSGQYEIAITYDAQKAIENLTKNTKLVILDIKMSGLDGIELFEKLKVKNPTVPIVFHSAYPGGGRQAEKIKDLNHNGYLVKGNYDSEELIRVVENLVNK